MNDNRGGISPVPGEGEWEAFVRSSLPETPPDDVAQAVTPWRRAVRFVLWGLLLTSVTLNFWRLDVILPSVGLLLCLLGFRRLRRENGWLLACWCITLLRTAYLMVQWFFNATVWQLSDLPPLVAGGVQLLLPAATFLLALCLGMGFAGIRRAAGFPGGFFSALWLPAWYAAVTVLALLQYRGLLMGLVLLVCYAAILRGLWRLSQQLEQAGYAVRPAVPRLSDKTVAALFAGAWLMVTACGLAFFSSYPMQWSPWEQQPAPRTEAAREELLALGFPQQVLDDLTPGEIEACRGATLVVADVWECVAQDGLLEKAQPDSDPAAPKLTITGVAVRLPGQRERWQVFHHFCWTNGVFYGTEAVELVPAWQMIQEGWGEDGAVSGRLLYDDDGGQVYEAPYYFLGERSFSYRSVFFGQSDVRRLFAAFSMPNEGKRHRGYLTYTAKEMQDGFIFDSWFNYTHQNSLFQYPVVTAEHMRQVNRWSRAGVFVTVEDALQFYPNADVVQPFS